VLARDYDGTIAPDGKVDNETAPREELADGSADSALCALQSNRSGQSRLLAALAAL
jgi:hypothetical protein